MYALMYTQAKLLHSSSLGLQEYTRKQVSGFVVNIIIELEKEKWPLFKELTSFELQTDEEFKGTLKLN
jgi:hypothetical protein